MVIIIIGILAAIAIPVFLNQRKKGVDASMKADLRSAAIVVDTWTADNPGIPLPLADGVWATATTPGTHPALAGTKVSPGNNVALMRGTTSYGYCLVAFSPNASTARAQAGPWMVYLSEGGGLQPTPMTIAALAGLCT